MKKLIPILLLAGSTFLAGCGDSNDFNQVSGQQGNPGQVIPLAPVANNDVYATDEDDALTVAAAQGVLANDQTNTNNPAVVTVTFPATTTQGGTLTQTDNTGAFTYTPALGFVGTDSFTYTLGNGFLTDTATVTIVVDAAVVTQGYFVDPAGNDTTGDFNSGLPYATIQGAVADAPVNATITVRPGNYTGAVTLKDGQTLRGVANSTRPTIAGSIVLADENTLSFLRIVNSASDAIDGDGQNGASITDCVVENAADNGISGGASSGNWTVEDNSFANVGGIAILLDTAGNDTMVARVNRNEISQAAFSAISFLSADASTLRAQVNDNVLLDSAPGFTFESIAGGTSRTILQLVGNQNSDVYSFNITAAGANIDVENYSELVQLNSNTGTIDTAGSVKAPNDIDDAGF